MRVAVEGNEGYNWAIGVEEARFDGIAVLSSLQGTNGEAFHTRLARNLAIDNRVLSSLLALSSFSLTPVLICR